MNIISIQSQVVYGHVGNSAVMFPLQRRGHEVWSVPTTILSNHSGYPDVGGQTLSWEWITDLLAGLERRGAFAQCELVVSGYLGNTDTAAVVANAVARVREANPDMVYCCDPVMGDLDTGLYVDRALSAYFSACALPAADIATPNLFELELLSGIEAGTLANGELNQIVSTARGLLEGMRPDACCLVTSACHRSLDPARVAAVAVDRAAAWYVEVPKLFFPVAPHGAGDLISSLFAVAMTDHGVVSRALEKCVAIVHAVLSTSAQTASTELDVVMASDGIMAPERVFAARKIV
ncbi:MAG TPA: pyridoxal kinase [Rhodospirillaceae bacterium]|nr:pyridoxal kinase [Rhodospirillaceae bacterium]